MKRSGILVFMMVVACGSEPVEIGSLNEGNRLPSPSGTPTAGPAGGSTSGRSDAATEPDAGAGARPVIPPCECPAIENAIGVCIARNSSTSCEYVCDVGYTFAADARCVPAPAGGISTHDGGRACHREYNCTSVAGPRGSQNCTLREVCR